MNVARCCCKMSPLLKVRATGKAFRFDLSKWISRTPCSANCATSRRIMVREWTAVTSARLVWRYNTNVQYFAANLPINRKRPASARVTEGQERWSELFQCSRKVTSVIGKLCLNPAVIYADLPESYASGCGRAENHIKCLARFESQSPSWLETTEPTQRDQ